MLRTREDIRAQSGQQMWVLGRYTQQDVRMRRERPAQLFQGHAALVLRDNHVVFLEPTWAPEALRSEEEVAQFQGEWVQVYGTIHDQAPSPPGPECAHIIDSCIHPVETIQLASLD